MIDAAELDSRKQTARQQATKQHVALTEIDDAFAAYTQASTARKEAEEAEATAKARLEVALCAVEERDPPTTSGPGGSSSGAAGGSSSSIIKAE